MEISLIFATYNRNEQISNLLNELGDIKDECEVIVVDDGSKVPVTFSGVKVLRHERNMGSPRSWNDGIEAATRKVVLLLPDDVHLQFRIEQLQWISQIAQDKIVGVRVIDKSGKMFNHRKLVKIIYWFSGQVFPPTDDEPRFTDFVHGTMAFPRSIPIRFDENFKGNAYREETDFQLRARRAGYRVLYFPLLSLTHDEIRHGGQSDKPNFDVQNHRYFLRKNYRRTWRLKMLCFLLYRGLRKFA